MPVRLAIIGLGAATRNIHLPAYRQLTGSVEVVAACEVDRAVAEEARRTLRLSSIYEDARRMLEAERPDMVSICTPPALHREQTLLALEHGCHVFCEKPLADSLEHADEIIRAAEGAGRHVSVNTQFPQMNIYTAAKEVIGSPAFGRLLFLHAWQASRPFEAHPGGWRNGAQGKLCLEFGVHVFELVRFFFDAEPARLYCQIQDAGNGAGSEALAIVSLQFDDGRAASIVLDRLAKGPERYLDIRLDGELGSVQTSIGGEARFEFGLRTRDRRPFVGIHLVQGGKAVLHNGRGSKVLAKDGMNPFATATAAQLSRILHAIENGVPPPSSARDNRNTLALALAAYESARSGTAVDMHRYRGF